MGNPVAEMLIVACESTGTELSKPTLKLWDNELQAYPQVQVVAALRKCCREAKGKLTLADVIARLQDGRPAVEEAWSIIAQSLKNEELTIVWTDEMREAYAVVAPLADDPVAARMAFKEQYQRLVSTARDLHKPVKWSVSLGYDANQRQAAIEAAVLAGRLTYEEGVRVCPQLPAPTRDAMKLIEQVTDAVPTMP